jgi:hypothetical protein
MELLEASAANPLPNVMGSDSSSGDAEAMGLSISNSLWLLYANFLAFLGSVVNTLVSPEQLTAGASVGHIGLGLPMLPPMVCTSSHLVVPGLESGPCK